MAGINNVGYSTHILGTVKSVMKCLGIILYNRYEISDTGLTRISLYNIKEVYKVLTKEGGKCVKISRNSTEEPFIYNKSIAQSGNLDNGFSTVIYLSPVDDAPLGYTEFRLVQGKDRDINITLDLRSSVEDLNVILNNSLSNVENSTNKNYLGDNLGEYTSSSIALDCIKTRENINKNYTKFLNQAKKSNYPVYLDSGFIKKFDLTGDLGFIKLNIFRNMNYSPLEFEFENFNISLYGSDIVLGTWTGLNYCITSLTQRNKFGELIRYTKSNTGYFTLPPKNGMRPYKILYNAGKYLICDFGNDTTAPFNIETREWEEITNSIALVDPLDPSNTLYDLTEEIDLSTIYKTFPDLVNTFYNYKQEKSIKILRKVGNWIVIRVMRDNRVVYVITGISYSLYITPEQLDKIIYLDDNTLILNSTDNYCIYRGIGEEAYTPEAARLLNIKTNAGAININKSSSLSHSDFNDLRRGPYPLTVSIPDIVTAFCGHLFYIDRQNHLINIL